ncbi:MAG TPA: histidinol dehydrogenase [Thermoanaerobaculia bacterium]|nr:histidinol dehydrogenase [Thermoanaerobaculia bacterium]
MRIFRANTSEAHDAMRDIEARRGESEGEALRTAREIIDGVRAEGDAFVASQLARFDRIELSPDEIKIAPRDVQIDPAIASAIDLAIERVEAFHRQQLPQSFRYTNEGTDVVHRVRPLRRVGIYVPGGRAVYLSTLIMGAVPARIAGVPEIVVATTPAAAFRDELHYTCARLGVHEIYRAGGAAGIAALALGTQTLRRVDKIAGPGNAYVTAAKQLLGGVEVGIDMTAGPTELVVIADDTSDPELVAADLLAQAEHGSDSSVICLTTSAIFADSLSAEVDRQIEASPSTSPARESAPTNGLILLAESRDETMAIANRVAPEHLSIHAADASWFAERAENCGAVFCGPWSPAAGGDYIIGPNHVLPTAGTARFYSPLGVYDFVKRSNIITMTAEEMAKLAPAAEAIAEFEGLPLHAKSVRLRRFPSS